MKFSTQSKTIIITCLALALGFGIYFVFHSKNSPPSFPIPTPTEVSPSISPTLSPSESPTPSPTVTPSPTPSPIPVSARPTRSPLNKEISLGNTAKKQIALTFDAGADSAQTASILKILKNNNLHCTFFITGKWAEQNPDLVNAIVANGHTLGNHTYDHKDLTTLTDAQIKQEFAKTEQAFQIASSKAIGKPYFRPPYGARNQHVWDYAASLGYQSIYWTVDALDWKEGITPTQVKQRIYNHAQNGAIVLMHVGDDITPEILQEVINYLQDKNYALVTLEKLIK